MESFLNVGLISYITGRPAVVTVLAPWESNELNADQSTPLPHYTLVYDDDREKTLLAMFTPNGAACVYYQNTGLVLYSCHTYLFVCLLNVAQIERLINTID